jgi:Copper binding proteins, plastocyanin/azurin family
MAETHQVTIDHLAFNPASITISAGDTVEWTNKMGIDHTVTPDNNEFPSSGHISPQHTFSPTFSSTGSVAYHCQIHPFMKGTITVTWSESEALGRWGRSSQNYCSNLEIHHGELVSITIKQQEGQITFTPDVPGARLVSRIGVNANDDLTWNNRTNQEIALKSIQPEGVFLCDPLPAGDVSNPIFNVTATVGYSWVRQHAPQPAQPDAWILAVS